MLAWLTIDVAVPMWALLAISAVLVADAIKLRSTSRQCDKAIALAQMAIDQIPSKP